MADELNERQQALIEQVKAGDVTEQLPDTHEQLMSLARLGHLTAEPVDGEWKIEPVGGRSKSRRSRAKKTGDED
jgi:hypothetical protein